MPACLRGDPQSLPAEREFGLLLRRAAEARPKETADSGRAIPVVEVAVVVVVVLIVGETGERRNLRAETRETTARMAMALKEACGVLGQTR